MKTTNTCADQKLRQTRAAIPRARGVTMNRTMRLLVALAWMSLMPTADSRAAQESAPAELLIKWADGPGSEAAVTGHRLIGGVAKRNLKNLGWQIVRLPAGMTVQEGLA